MIWRHVKFAVERVQQTLFEHIERAAARQQAAIASLAATMSEQVEALDRRIEDLTRTLASQQEALGELRDLVDQRFDGLRHQLAKQRAASEALADDSREWLYLNGALSAAAQRDAAAIALEGGPAACPLGAGLSVLIPCWQHGGYLEDAVTSALAAVDDVGAGEVVVLIDGSRDESSRTARALSQEDARVRVIDSPKNLGLARARNILVERAAFQHAVFLDADNILLPGGCATLIEAARAQSATLAYGRIHIADGSERTGDVVGRGPVTRDILTLNMVDALAMVDVSRLRALGGFSSEAVEGFEDWELAVRLARLGELICCVPAEVGVYRASELSMRLDSRGWRVRARRVRRMYDVDGRFGAAMRSVFFHPSLGVLWSWSPVERSESREKPVLCVTRDAAALEAAIESLHRSHEGAAIAVLAEGALFATEHAICVGTLDDYCESLEPSDLDPRSIAEGLESVVGPAERTDWLLTRYGCRGQCRLDLSAFAAVVLVGEPRDEVGRRRRAVIEGVARAAGVDCRHASVAGT